jgi:hypothetical protein
MLLRVCLIVAILAGLGVVLLSQLQLRPQIQTIIDQREENARQREDQRKRANKAEADLKNTREKLASTEKNLQETQTELTSTKTKLDNEQKRATSLQKDLDNTKALLTAKDQELSAWKAIGLSVEQVITLRDERNKLANNNEALLAENKLLGKQVRELQTQIDNLLGKGEEDPILPTNLRGKVVVVDPKWNFVVLDIGEADGVRTRGVLLVSRNSKLVAKVRVMSVQSNRSIANIIPGWKLGEVFEGDIVLPN